MELDPWDFGSICSGIEAATVAFEPLGLVPAWFSEIEKFPNALLRHYYRNVANLGDMTKIPELLRSCEIRAPRVICGGTPCQSFSFGGKGESLNDPRGQLTLTFCEIVEANDAARAIRGFEPCGFFWENVPGVLNKKDNSFGCFLGKIAGETVALEPPGGRWSNAGCIVGPKRVLAWRVLDAQFFGLAQRRQRVFVVGSARDGFDPVKVLFEPESLRRNTPPSRSKGKGTSADVAPSIRASGVGDSGFALITPAVTQNPYGDNESREGLLIAHTLTGEGYDASEDGTGRGTPIVPVYSMQAGIDRDGGGPGGKVVQDGKIAGAIDTQSNSQGVCEVFGPRMAVRRLTPRECERLQGFPDDYTLIPRRHRAEKDPEKKSKKSGQKQPKERDPEYLAYLERGGRLSLEECKTAAADGPRYKAIGNSWAINCVRWLGRRFFDHLRELSEKAKQ